MFFDRILSGRILGLGFLALFSAFVVQGADEPMPAPRADLPRVDRRPGILPGDPSELPNGEQAGLYIDLLETDPANTSFKAEWQARDGL